MPIETGTDLDIHWDNTVKLSTIYQPGRASYNVAGYCAAVASASARSSDRSGCAYGANFISGRLDWLSELDIDYRDFGIHASAAAWYDAVNDNRGVETGSAIYNPYSGSYTEVAEDTSELGGRNIELFEAFFHGTVPILDDRSLSFRIGRHTLIWGESLYFADNGIAAGQAPVDTYMVHAISSYQSRDSFLPIGQASFSFQATDDFALEGYYQFEWRRSRINPLDAYTSATQVLGAEGNRLIALSVPGFGPVYYNRIGDQAPTPSGQYGLAAKLHLDDMDYGLYALRFNETNPVLYLYPGAISVFPQQSPVGAYRLTYPKSIEIYGLSVSGPLGEATFGAEMSGRRNMPLVNGGILVPPSLARLADSGGHPLYPVGDTLHAQFSWVYVVPPLPGLPAGARWTGEIAANHLLSTTANSRQLEPGRTRTAASFRTVFEPQFFQVLPRVDITVPIGFGYNFLGLSEVDPAMNRGTGDVSIGVTATIDQTWKVGLGLTHYFGWSKNDFVPFRPVGGEHLSNWDFIGVTVQRSF